MATIGEQIWAAELRSLGRKSPLNVSMKRATLVSVVFQVGRWASFVTKEAQVGTLVVKEVHLTSTRKLTPKVYLRFHSMAWGVGGFTYILKLKDWPWRMHRVKSGYEYAFAARDLRLLPGAYLQKMRHALRNYGNDPHSSIKRQPFSKYRRALTGKTSPVGINRLCQRYSENYSALVPSNTWSYRSDGPISLNAYYHAWTSVRTPGFGRLRKSELPINNWSSSIVFTNNNPGGLLVDSIVKSGWSSYAWYSHAWTYTTAVATLDLPTMPSHSVGAYNKALSRLVDKGGLQIEANLAQDLAQYQQSVRLFQNTCFRIAGTVRSLRRGQFAAAADYLWHGQNLKYRDRSVKRLSNTKTLAENLLELQYGWKPLLHDVEGSIRSLKKLFDNDRTIQVVRASARIRGTTPMNPILKYGVVVGHGEKFFTSTTRFGLRYKVDSAAKSFAAQLGFTNPVNLFWEVLPWSFVLDWAWPIGTYLELLSAFDGLTFVDGFCTQFSKQRLTAEISFNGPVQASGGNVRAYGSYDRTTIQVNRTKLTTFPSPKIPRLKNPISRVHVANALALLRTAFASDPRSMRRSQKPTFGF